MDPPVLCRICLAHDIKRSRQGVRQHSFFRYDGHGKQAGICRIAGAGIQDVDIGLPVLLKIPLIATGGNHRPVLHLQRQQHILCPASNVRGGGNLRIPNSDFPVCPVRFRPQGLDIAAQGHHTRSHAVLPVKLHDPVRCISLGDATQIHLLS